MAAYADGPERGRHRRASARRHHPVLARRPRSSAVTVTVTSVSPGAWVTRRPSGEPAAPLRWPDATVAPSSFASAVTVSASAEAVAA